MISIRKPGSVVRRPALPACDDTALRLPAAAVAAITAG
jgi:hypothetical protein